MEGWRFLVAVVLMIAVVVVTNMLFGPPPPEEQPPVRDTIGAPAPAPAAGPDSPAAGPDSPAAPPEAPPELADTAPPQEAPLAERDTAPAETGEALAAADTTAPTDTVVIESALYRYGFTTRGAALVSAQLLRHASFTHDGPVELAPAGEGGAAGHPLLRHRLRIGDEVVDLGRAEFETSHRDTVRLAAGDPPLTLRFRHRTERGADVVLEYEFHPERYLVEGRAALAGLPGAPILLLDLGPTLGANEADPREDQNALAYVVNSARAGIRSVRLSSVDAPRIEEGPLFWAALKNKYFVAAVLPPEGDGAPYGGLIVEDAPGEHEAELTATLPDADADGTLAWRLYFGPQDADRLSAIGHDFHNVNPIGWRLFRPIIGPLAQLVTWALVELHNLLGIGYGWVLIVFGFIVRGLLWPLNARAMRAQLKNMEVQPLLKEVQAKYKNEPERLQKEMLRLYKEEGFNPLGGCLPMLIPFPVLITLFFVFQNTIEFRGVDFLWLPDLSRPDPLYLLPVMLGVSMFVLQWISLRSAPQSNPQMKMMMWFMPIFMVVIFLNLASGLNLYYAASNVATVPQQILLMRERKRFHDARQPRGEPATEPAAEAKAAEPAKQGAGAGKGESSKKGRSKRGKAKRRR